ncbi:MAG: PaaI family thioesterase [Hydrogenophilus thermoluteolus]
MALIRAERTDVQPGTVTITLPCWDGIRQQHGYVHGGVVAMIADSAAGYAAMTLAPPNTSVLTVEYKINLVAPALGKKLIAEGSVLRSGKTLSLTQARVFAVTDDEKKLCAVLQQTIMICADRPER